MNGRVSLWFGLRVSLDNRDPLLEKLMEIFDRVVVQDADGDVEESMGKEDSFFGAVTLGSAHADEEGTLLWGVEKILVDLYFRVPGSARVVGDANGWKGEHELASR